MFHNCICQGNHTEINCVCKHVILGLLLCIGWEKLDKLMASRHLKSTRSLSGRSLHLTFQGHGQGQTWWSLRPSVQSIWVFLILWRWSHFWLRYNKFHIRGQGHSQGNIRWSHLRLRVQSTCLFFISWQSDNFWPKYSKFHIDLENSRSRSWQKSTKIQSGNL